MKDADRKRERLLNCRQRAAVKGGESKESKKLRDSNCTTLMLIVVITVSEGGKSYGWVGLGLVFTLGLGTTNVSLLLQKGKA
jgi:hypothetical protein